MNKDNLEKIIKNLLIELGEDPEREGLKNTPQRVAQMFKFITSGEDQSLKEIVNNAVFAQKSNSMIVLSDIEIYSTCEHHLLPFFGTCQIGYIAKDKVIGISKIARIIDMFARRLQLQERLTEQIADSLMKAVKPMGVGVVIKAKHMCMMMRGVEKQNSTMITSSVLGSFRKNNATREEFFSIINSRH